MGGSYECGDEPADSVKCAQVFTSRATMSLEKKNSCMELVDNTMITMESSHSDSGVCSEITLTASSYTLRLLAPKDLIITKNTHLEERKQNHGSLIKEIR